MFLMIFQGCVPNSGSIGVIEESGGVFTNLTAFFTSTLFCEKIVEVKNKSISKYERKGLIIPPFVSE